MTNAEAWFNNSLRPRKPEGSLGRTAQDGHLDSHTAPELWLIHRVFTRVLRAKATRYGPSDLWSVLHSFVTQQIAIISDFSPGLFWAEVIFLNVMLRDGVTGSAAEGYDRLRSWSSRFGVCGRWSPLELPDVITRITDRRRRPGSVLSVARLCRDRH